MKLIIFFIWLLFSRLVNAVPTAQVERQTQVSSLESEPNPIALQYPDSITGTINGTLAVIPIPYALARSIIPSQWGILSRAYESLLPGFPPNSYPLFIKAILDHDIRVGAFNLTIPDFQSVHIKFPFVDLLGDGYSTFAWEKYLLLTSTNQVALDAIASYGQIPVPATLDPFLEAYKFVNSAHGKHGRATTFNANTNTSSPAVTTEFSPLPEVGPWPMKFYVNVTNQPVFGDGLSCDNQFFLYNTSLSLGANAAVGVKGRIEIEEPYLPQNSSFENVFGIKIDSAFVEIGNLSCQSLQGYSGP